MFGVPMTGPLRLCALTIGSLIGESEAVCELRHYTSVMLRTPSSRLRPP